MHRSTVGNYPDVWLYKKSIVDSIKNNWDHRGHRMWAPIITIDDKTWLIAVKTIKQHTTIRHEVLGLLSCPTNASHAILTENLTIVPWHGLQGLNYLDTTTRETITTSGFVHILLNCPGSTLGCPISGLPPPYDTHFFPAFSTQLIP